MAAVNNVERRKEPRIDREDMSIFADWPGKGLNELPLFDISSRGLGLRVSEQLKPGQTFKFRIDLPPGAVRGSACVRWVQPHHLGYRCGVSIENMGWTHRRRLFYFLRPDKEDPVRVFDRILMTSFFLVSALVALDFMGLSVDRILALVRYLLPPR